VTNEIPLLENSARPGATDAPRSPA